MKKVIKQHCSDKIKKEDNYIMKNKNNNKLLQFTNIVLLITIFAIILVAGTYAKYTSSASGTDATVVAKWSFKVNGEEIAVEGDAKTVNFGLFDTINDSNGDEETDVKEGLIAPGTQGAFEFELKNTSEVTTKYDIKLNVDNINIPLEFSFDGETWKSDTDDLVATDIMAIGATKNVVVSWRWAFGEDVVTDATLGAQTVNIDASITATQVDSSAIDPIVYEEKQIFSNVLNDFPETNIASSSVVKPTYSAFAYQNVDLFAGKIISKIGIPIKSVSAIDNNQTFTIHVVDKNKVASRQKAEPIRTYVVSPKKADLGSNPNAVNKWVYIDLTSKYIVLSENETLAFGDTTDTVMFGYNSKSNSAWSKQSTYYFNCNIEDNSVIVTQENLLFDIYYKEQKSETTNNLKSVLKGKTLSILGDSISTFAGYNNNTQNNDTIGNNAVWYSSSNDKGITDVNDSWWMQTINNNDMKLLVNNAWSGSTVFANTNGQGANSIAYSTERPVNLHDNTEDATFANGTEPDIIATYIGINDFNTNMSNLGTYEAINFDTLITDNEGSYSYGTPTTIVEAYAIMVHKMKTRYTSSDIYLFTMAPNTWKVDDVKMEEFNSAIRQIASKYNLTVVDLYKDSGITRDNVSAYLKDGLHPNALGMDKITETFEKALEKNYLNN